MNDREHLFRTERLVRVYTDGDVTALAEMDLEICRGDYVAIMGPSGSGKSTLLNLLGGLDRPTSGEIYFRDEPLSRLRDLDRFRAQEVGFVFQSSCLLPTLTAAENVQLPMFEGPLSSKARDERARQLLQYVGLGHRYNHLPGQLSVGERQRVAIARALANEPQALLADEPTGNLDSHSATQTLDLLDSLHEQRKITIVIVTHSYEVAVRADRTIYLRDGHVVEDTGSCRVTMA